MVLLTLFYMFSEKILEHFLCSFNHFKLIEHFIIIDSSPSQINPVESSEHLDLRDLMSDITSNVMYALLVHYGRTS